MNSQWVLFILFTKRSLSQHYQDEIARFRYLFMLYISYDPSGMTISLSSSKNLSFDEFTLDIVL